MKRLFKILRYTVAILLLLLVTVVVLVNLTPVQNYLAGKAADILSKKLKTRVEVAHVRIDFLNHILLQGLYIEDQAHDTLLYAGEAQVRINDWFIFKDKPVLHYLGLQNTYVHMYRKSSSDWNYGFIADAFSTGKKDTSKGKPFEFDLKVVALENVRFHMDDKWGGEDLDFDVGNLAINAKDLNFDKKLLDIKDIVVKNTDVTVREYKPGHPPRKHNAAIDTFDTTPFNKGKWSVKSKSLSLDGCTFHLVMDDLVPVPGEFDQNHLAIKNIQASTSDLSITGDTIHGTINHLFAQERCGITIKDMRSKVTISPIASICENLYLETNYSKVQNYFAMHYKHFPDFTSYIDSVVMVAHIKDAIVDKRDIAYFAPQIKNFPQVVLRVTGDGKGTVANLGAQHLMVSDGNSVVKGNITMKGLPDIYKTYITFTDGEIVTNGPGILRYVPGLRNSPDVALERLTYAYFKGKYEGHIENFVVNGIFNTNLGSLATDIKMKIPGFNSNTAVYSGSVATNDLQLGILLKQPLLGGITLKEDISGSSFNPDQVQLNIDGTISEININSYPYRKIITHGMLAKKQFDGTLLVDDPNLALEFDGGINYSNKNVNIKAKAHLLGSNFHALHLTTDTITASADFDLDCTGSNIDNFTGYAKLNNIDLKRNTHKLAIDSVFVNATGNDSMRRLLTVQSNDVVASIKGNYQLSKLPASFQYYLSRYLPNYVKTPQKYAPDQNLEFTIKTTTIDSILAVVFPLVRGFDSSSVSGSLNTSAHKLTLNATVPYGTIGNFHMSNIVVAGTGNLDMIGLSANVDNVAIGDSFLNGSLSLTTTVANDSIGFTIATTTPDTSGSITLNGQVLARRDSLFLTVFPSQFYLNQVKWDIAGGSKIVYSDKYLMIQGFSITSGLQKISAATELQNNDKSIIITTDNLDLGQFGSWAGLAMYQPDGRLNGTIKIDKLFQDFYISANMKATNVKFGSDTVGTINLIGDYDGAKKLLTLDPQTGIYRGDASVVASGNISLDSTTHQKLDGSIQFNNAPVVWASPFLAGIMSHLSGTLNGKIGFVGTSYDPILDGQVFLTKAGLRLDYLGCNYTIPEATIHIDNKRISFGTVQILDNFKNQATLTGYFAHNLFKNMRMHLKMQSDKFEVMNLTSNDNNLFYGNLIASMDSFNIRGPFNNIRLNIYNAAPAAKSHIYIPVTTTGDVGTYSYVSFKTYGNAQNKIVRKSSDKIHITIDANLNTLAEMTIVLDPSTGDAITARGDGNIQLDIPPNNDMRTNGIFTIDEGTYTFTFRQLFIKRQFLLNSGSIIRFNGPFGETRMDVDATYGAKARLYDLLSDAEKTSAVISGSELTDAETSQTVNVLLHMNGTLKSPKLTFDLDLPEKHSVGTYAYTKLMRINQDDRQKFDQVASLLLINDFIPPEGLGGATAATGAINNISQIISSTASTGLTNIVNKITGDKQVNIDVKYTNYNYSDQTLGALNRSQVKVGVNKNYFNDRLLVEVGSTSDWGHPANTSNTSNFNLTGDFRIQYQLTQASGLRLNCFRTSDYDVTLDRDIVRSGVGITWRKSFDGVGDFFHGNRYARREKEQTIQKIRNMEDTTTTTKRKGGTD